MYKEEISALKDLLNDKKVKSIFKLIEEKYDKLSFTKRKELLITFNDILSDALESDTTLYINPTNDSEEEEFEANSDTFSIYINGSNVNPYQAIKEIIFYNLALINDGDYKKIYVGNDIKFDTNLIFDDNNVLGYYGNNINYKRIASGFVEHFIKDSDSKCAKEVKKTLDFNLDKENIKDLVKASKAYYNSFANDEDYKYLLMIDNKVKEMVNTQVSDSRDLAYLSIDAFFNQCSWACNSENFKDNFKRFINIYFPEFKDLVKIEITESNVKLNSYVVNDTKLFMDTFLTILDKIDKSNDYKIINNYKPINFNPDSFNHKLTKQQIYFYDKLILLDKVLANHKNEVINYLPFTQTFKFDDDVDLYMDNDSCLIELVNNQEFIDKCNCFLKNKRIDKKTLIEIFEILKKAYNKPNYACILDEAYMSSDVSGTCNNQTVYVNLRGYDDTQLILATLFHEFRHLIQEDEYKVNTGIYNPKIYKYIQEELINTPYQKGYGYLQLYKTGYVNELFYGLQPLEYDAENFSKILLSEVINRIDDKIKLNQSSFNPDYNKDFKYFSNQKASLLLYDFAYKFYKVEKTLREDRLEFNQLTTVMGGVNYNNAYVIFGLDNFCYLPMMYKKEVYYNIFLNPDNLKCIDENHYQINDKIFDISEMSEYEILEQILINNAHYLFSKGELNILQAREYIQSESLKYKPSFEEINEDNACKVHDYYKVFNKYRLHGRKKEKENTKKR